MDTNLEESLTSVDHVVVDIHEAPDEPDNIEENENSGGESENECYICLQACGNEYMHCQCRAPVHTACYLKYYATSGEATCSICKTIPGELLILRVRPFVQNSFSCTAYCVTVVAVFLFFSIIVSIDTEIPTFRLAHPLNYFIIFMFSIPSAGLCALRKTTTFEYPGISHTLDRESS
jgi:hypothetical protein